MSPLQSGDNYPDTEAAAVPRPRYRGRLAGAVGSFARYKLVIGPINGGAFEQIRRSESANCAPVKISTNHGTTAAHPKHFGMVLADGAAPSQSFWRNPVSLLCIAVCCASILMFFLPRFLDWGWRAQHFGVTTFLIGSVMLLGGVPWLCILFFAKTAVSWRILSFLAYVLVLAMWAFRFVKHYRWVFADDGRRSAVYAVTTDAFLYLQKSDNKLLEGPGRPSHFPHPLVVITAFFLATVTIFLPYSAERLLGLPSVHIFLAIAAVPIDMMAAGFVGRGLCIYYFYPAKLLRMTGKTVFVDLTGKARR